jgi:thymidylate synthase ThyX
MAKVFLYDEQSPEDVAMMQALYSRSPKSVEEHVRKVAETGSGKFMESFYVGYGHASIADCGSTTLFIEGVSVLCAKAIQDWPLYSGQETSTRYIDMSEQALFDPLKTKASQAILKGWMDFYTSSGPKVEEFLQKKYPRGPQEDERVYHKAIRARSFDILRGFLPAGITTQLSWHTNLRQAWDKISLLRHHPLAEVRETADAMWKQLQKKYPHSFSHPLFPEQEAYRDQVLRHRTYFAPKKFSQRFRSTHTLTQKALLPYRDLLKKRPIKTNLPFFMRGLGTSTFEFVLDFGSFRDLQRHRASIYHMPLLTTQYGFHAWYMNQLPESLQKKAGQLVEKQKRAIERLRVSEEDRQYFIPLGFQVPCRFTFDLPAALYFIELRSGRMVHPTLRPIAHAMYSEFKQAFPMIELHGDLGRDDWDICRGLQDIQKK